MHLILLKPAVALWDVSYNAVSMISERKPCYHAYHAGADDHDRPLFIFEGDVRMVKVIRLHIFLVTIEGPKWHAKSIPSRCLGVADGRGS